MRYTCTAVFNYSLNQIALLRIRLTRTGKKAQPSFRIVVGEHSRAVQRKYLEILGQYVPQVQPKILKVNKERIQHWLSVGAQPSDTVAVLLKKEGFADMDKFIAPRNKKTKSKKEKPEEAAPASATPKAEAAPAEAAPTA